MQIDTVLVDIETLIPDPNNERKHDEKNLKAIRNSLKQFGQVEPLIVRRSNNVVIGGNGRLEAMKAIGLTEAVIHYVDFDELKSKALRVALNRTSELASWDEAMLGNTLQELREHDFDLDELGFDISSLDKPDASDDLPDLKSGDQEPFQQITFSLSDAQAATVREAVAKAIAMAPFDTAHNINENGNAISRICELFVGGL